MTARRNGIGTPEPFDREPLRQRVEPEKTWGTRKPLKRSPFKRRKPQRRPMKPDAMIELVADVMLRDGRCVACDLTLSPCEGHTEAHHLISQSILKRHYAIEHGIFRDPRNCVALCRLHHTQVERGLLHLPESVLPIGFYPFLREFGFEPTYEAQVLRRVA